MDLHKSGLITEEETEIPWSKFGTSEFVQVLTRKIALREGYGDLIAQGPLKVAETLSPEARLKMGFYFPAYGQGEHYELRAYPMYLLQWAVDSRDPLADTHDWSTFHSWQHHSWPLAVRGHLTDEDLKEIGKIAYGMEDAYDSYSYENKAKVLYLMQNSSRLKNSLVVCDWMFPIYSSTNNNYNYEGDPDIERRLFCTATGIELNKKEWQQTGERIYNLERALLVRDNQRSREQDTVEDFHFEVPVTRLQPWEPAIEPMTADREKLEKAKDEFYQIRGWDVSTGRPTRSKLEELKLKDVADELDKLSLIP
jgi:aldehyde:ferredoxin oxidoreductase